MTRFLASVCNVTEAMMVLAAGVDIIDLKDPSKGALGALPLQTLGEITRIIDGRAVVSATIGDLAMEPAAIVFAAEHTARQGIDIVKVGFFGEQGSRECIAALEPLAAQGIKIMAVLFADQQPDFDLLPRLRQSGFCGVMLDTASKGSKGLVDCISMRRLEAFLMRATECQLEAGLAGSLKIADIAVLQTLVPGFLGFRGALCENGSRTQRLVQKNLMEVKTVLRESNIKYSNAGWA